MLKHLRQKIIEALQLSKTIALATSGEAGLEISPCRIQLEGLHVLLFIPATSEHLVNIEQHPQVAVTNVHWRLIGVARIQQRQLTAGGTHTSAILEVIPTRFEFLHPETNQVTETIDVGEGEWGE